MIWRRVWLVGIWLALIGLAGCGAMTVNQAATPTPATAILAASPGATPSPISPLQVCPADLFASTLAAIVQLSADAHIEQVVCADLKHDGGQEAVVSVRHADGAQSLDLAVVPLPAQATTAPLFSLTGLMHGDMLLSHMGTILTKTVDPLDCLNATAATTTALQPSLAQEYAWNGTTFAPQPFAGLAPFTSAYDLERAQQASDLAQSGVQNPVAVVTAFMLTQPGVIRPDDRARLLAQDGATANVTYGGLSVRLSRLVRPAEGGIWEITSIDASATLGLASPQSGTTVQSGFSLNISGTALKGSVQVTLRDHAGCRLGGTTLSGPTGALSYHVDGGIAKGTPQTGTLWLSATSPDGVTPILQAISVLLI